MTWGLVDFCVWKGCLLGPVPMAPAQPLWELLDAWPWGAEGGGTVTQSVRAPRSRWGVGSGLAGMHAGGEVHWFPVCRS